MTREVLVMQTGQCGNQLGSRLWDTALQDHASMARTDTSGTVVKFDRGMNVMFRNVDHRTGYPLQLGDPVSTFKARAVLIDMENGVIDSILRSPLGELFTQPQIVTDVSGSGNNWATGYMHYGACYGERIIEAFRTQLECCDCVDSVFFLQSLSGGTGSGLGSYLVERVADLIPKVNRLVIPVFPSVTDNVVTAPYNAILSMRSLLDHANVVIAVDNDSLFNHEYHSSVPLERKGKYLENPYDPANAIVARMVQAITTGVRHGGETVAFPSDIKVLTCGNKKFLSPILYMFSDTVTKSRRPLTMEAACSGRLSERYRLVRSIQDGAYASSGYFYVGQQQLNSVLHTMNGLKSRCDLVGCTSTNLISGSNFLQLSNCTSFHTMLSGISNNVSQLFKRKAHLHHYLEFIEREYLAEAVESLKGLVCDYRTLQQEIYDPAKNLTKTLIIRK